MEYWPRMPVLTQRLCGNVSTETLRAGRWKMSEVVFGCSLHQPDVENRPETKFTFYTVSGKKGATLFCAITLSNPNRSSKFFYRHTQQ